MSYIAALYAERPHSGAGIALTEGVSPRVTLLGLAILIAAGIVSSTIELLGGAHPRNPGADLAKPS